MMAMNKSYFPLTYYMKTIQNSVSSGKFCLMNIIFLKEMMFEITVSKPWWKEESVSPKIKKLEKNSFGLNSLLSIQKIFQYNFDVVLYIIFYAL